MAKKNLKVERRKFVVELFEKQCEAHMGSSNPWGWWIDLVMKDFHKHRKDYMNDPINAQIFTRTRHLKKNRKQGDHWFTFTYLNSPQTRKFIRNRLAAKGIAVIPMPFDGMEVTKDSDRMKLSQTLTHGATKTRVKNDNVRSRLLNKFGNNLGIISTRLRLPA